MSLIFCCKILWALIVKIFWYIRLSLTCLLRESRTKICYLRQFQAAVFDLSRCKISMGQILQKKLFNANRFLFSYNYLKGKLLWKIWSLSNFLPELGARFLQRQPLKSPEIQGWAFTFFARKCSSTLKAQTDRTRIGNATRIFSFQWHLILIFFNVFQIFGTT
jgi:hypothetical protein